MKKRERKGFTIVELVIVIAIVAVLAAIIIPTFSSLIDKANQSADIQAAQQLNTALAAGSIPNRPTGIGDVINILAAAGYNSEDCLKPITTNFCFFWYQEENVIVLAEVPKFLGAALALETVATPVPAEYKATVWFPDDKGEENSIAAKFETILNEMIEVLWKAGLVDGYGNLKSGTTKADIYNAVTEFGYDALKYLLSCNLENGKDILKDIVDLGKPYVPLNSMTLNQQELNLILGGAPGSLSVTFDPVDASYTDVRWSTGNSAIAQVDAQGNVTAIGAGTTTITATSIKSSSISATCNVTVSYSNVSGFSLDKSTASIDGRNNKITLTPTITIENANATTPSVNWVSSNDAVATVENGAVTAKSSGTVTITATCGGKEATCVVTVTIPVESVEILRDGTVVTNSTITLVKDVDIEATLSAKVTPDDASNKSVKWSSSKPGVVSIEETTGKITVGEVGTAVITATEADGKTAEVNVTVTNIKVESIAITAPDDTSLTFVGSTLELKAVVTTDPDGAEDKMTVNWSSDNTNVATVENGVVTAVSSGTATITAECGGKTETCVVTVNIPVESVTITGIEEILHHGTTTLVAKVLPIQANVTSVKWEVLSESENGIVSIDNNGNVTAHAVGTATIKVTINDGGHTATFEVKVTPILVRNITLSSSSMTLNPGGTGTLSVTEITPVDASDMNIIWSITGNDDDIITFKDGNIFANKPGTVTITAATKYGGATATCTVTVESIPVTGVTLDKESLILAVGDNNVTLTAKVTPDNTTEDKTVTWEVTKGTDVVDVDDKGQITAKKAGTATVTATAGGITANCEITVLTADEMTVKKINDLLTADVKNFVDVCHILRNAGYDVEEGVSPTKGYEFFWQRELNVFFLAKDDEELGYVLKYPTDNNALSDYVNQTDIGEIYLDFVEVCPLAWTWYYCDYDELEEAFEFGGEVVLQGDYTITDKIVVYSNVTLDLNGHTLTLDATSSCNALIDVDSGATLTIKDSAEAANKGTINAFPDDNNSYAAIEVRSANEDEGKPCGTLNLIGVNIVSDGGCAAISNRGNTTIDGCDITRVDHYQDCVVINTGNLTIKGDCTLTAQDNYIAYDDTAPRHAVIDNSNGTTTFEGDKIVIGATRKTDAIAGGVYPENGFALTDPVKSTKPAD